MKIGFGYDSHALVKGKPLVLGGIKVPFNSGLKGYSDADVLLHAVMDALLGAAGQPDIGTLFPAGNKKFKDISSLLLLKEVRSRIKGFSLGNMDAVIIADKPPLNQYLPEMKKNIAAGLGVKVSRVSLKVKHAEGFGASAAKFMAAYAVCLLK